MSLNDAIVGRQQQHKKETALLPVTAEKIVKAGRGVFYGISGRVRTGTSAITLYIQLVDSATAGDTSPNIMHSIPVRQLTANETNFDIEIPNGIRFENGLKVGISGTPYGIGYVNEAEYTVLYE